MQGKSVATDSKKGPGRPKSTKSSSLTRMQELFVKEYVSNDGQITQTQAAINAGYAVESAHTRSTEMLNPNKCPHVVERVRTYRAELDKKYGITFERHIRDLQKIRDEALAAGAYSAAVQAEHRRGQAHGGIYVSKSEIRTGSIDSMSKEEVLKALKDIEEQRKEYAPITIDVTPEEESNPQYRDKTRGQLLEADEGGHGEDG